VTATGKVAGTTNYTFDASSTHLGLFLGLYIPFIKVRASYFLKSTLKTEADSTPAVLKSGDEFEGKGMSIGAGISVFPFITLNVDYRNFTYDALNPYPNSAGPYEVDGKISEILISLSVPL
jgi:hypothetical protein